MSKEEFCELLDSRCESAKDDIETRCYPSEADQLESLREEFRETVDFLASDCDFYEEVKVHRNEYNEQEVYKYCQILKMDAACLQDDYEHGYTIFDDPQKIFATGPDFSLEQKRKELEDTAQWGEIDVL